MGDFMKQVTEREEAELRALIPDDSGSECDESESEFLAEVEAKIAEASKAAIAKAAEAESEEITALAQVHATRGGYDAPTLDEQVDQRPAGEAFGAGEPFAWSLWAVALFVYRGMSALLFWGGPQRAGEGEPLLGDVEHGQGQPPASSGIAEPEHSSLMTLAQTLRLSHVLLGLGASTDGAQAIFEQEVHPRTGTTAALEAQVRQFEAFSAEERQFVLIQSMIESHSPRHAAAWIRLAFALFANGGCMPVVLRPQPERSLLSSAPGLHNIYTIMVGTWFPWLRGVQSPYLAYTSDGHTVAPSFVQLELAAGFYYRACNVAAQTHLHGQRDRPALIGGVVDDVLDAFMGVTPVVPDARTGRRVQTAQLCRIALATPEVRAAMLEFLISMFVLVVGRGFIQVPRAHYSLLTHYLLPTCPLNPPPLTPTLTLTLILTPPPFPCIYRCDLPSWGRWPWPSTHS